MTVGGCAIAAGDAVVLDPDGVAVVPSGRLHEVVELSLAREERERVKRAKLEAGALSYDLDGLRERVEGSWRERARGDIAHIHHVEVLTPEPEASLEFYVNVLGMEVEHREGQSVFLRCWGDYQRYSLKLTESDRNGLGHMALRAWSDEALERRVAAIEASGLGRGWTRRRPRARQVLHTSWIPTGTRWSCSSRPTATSRRTT